MCYCLLMKNKSYIAILPLFFLVITSCGVSIPKEVKIIHDELSTNLTIHSEEQKEVLEAEDPAYLIDNNTATYGRTSNSKPLPITISWNEENDINKAASFYLVKISELEDMSNPITYTSKENIFDIYNLKINTRYYYSISANHHGHYFDSNVKSFIINEKAPRNLFVDGVENCRDLGGWNIGEGKIYKQGLIYRTAQFNYGGGLNSFVSEPSKEGQSTLLDVLKIKTDIDLRKTASFNGGDEVNGISSSPLGKNVNYVSCPIVYGNANIFTQDENKPSIKLFFETLANENNYPIAFHCVRGTDRTGALAYVLSALVGMNEEDLMLDYLFSDLANIGNPVKASTINGEGFYIQGIANSDGASYAEKAKNYLINNVGVSSQTLDTIVSILTK